MDYLDLENEWANTILPDRVYGGGGVTFYAAWRDDEYPNTVVAYFPNGQHDVVKVSTSRFQVMDRKPDGETMVDWAAAEWVGSYDDEAEAERRAAVRERAREAALDRLASLLEAQRPAAPDPQERIREREELRRGVVSGEHDDETVELEVAETSTPARV